MKQISVKDFKETFGSSWKKEWRKHCRESYRINGDILDFFIYDGVVQELTNKIVHLVEGYDATKRHWKGYHIDHKISRFYGYKNGIDPKDISHISNLRFVDFEANRSKGRGNIVDDLNRWIIE